MSGLKHFLDINHHNLSALNDIMDRSMSMKTALKTGKFDYPMAGRTLVMIFEKPSTRTRVSFQVGFQQMGGMTVVMGDQE